MASKPKKRPTPEQIGAVQSEHAQSCAVFAWAAMQKAQHPELEWLHAIPNGGERNVIVASRLKAEGVRKGVSDICLPVARGSYHGLYLELKLDGRQNEKKAGVITGGRSDEQRDFLAFVQAQGYAGVTCYGWEHATRAIAGYLGLGPFARPAPVAMKEEEE